MKKTVTLSWLACLALLAASAHLAAEETAYVKDGRANVRGQPSLVGEVITQLQKGEKVVILEEVSGPKSRTNEPPKWARIQMPANTPVWVYAPYIDPAGKTVKVTRLNLRAGPGENYSVVGRLAKGASITEIRRVEDWIEIEAPAGAYAFVAANLLTKTAPEGGAVAAAKPEPAKATPAATPPPPAPKTETTPAPAATPHAAVENQPAATPPPVAVTPPNPLKLEPAAPPSTAETPAAEPKTPPAEVKNEPAPTPAVTAAAPAVAPVQPATTATPPPPAAAPAQAKAEQQAPIRRIVRREGLVRSTVSIQAPTYYELLSPGNRKTINYLHADNLEVDLKDYRGRRIIVTGEEAIDPRWPKTPVIEVQTLELIP